MAFIRDLITYEAGSLEQLKKEFEFSVDDYLLSCKERNKEPDKPFKGSFNVRIGQDLHRKAMMQAIEQDMNLNEFVKQSIEKAVHT